MQNFPHAEQRHEEHILFYALLMTSHIAHIDTFF